MNNDNPGPLLLGIVILIAVAGWAGCYEGVKQERREAVKQGAARYVGDEKTGESKFEYIKR